MTGAELIAAERRRQIEHEGWSAEHDDRHAGGDLALAACCYAAPCRIYARSQAAHGVCFFDPWPAGWGWSTDKRYRYGACRENANAEGGGRPDPATYSHEERIDLLAKAGALIAAEIDRLQRLGDRLRQLEEPSEPER